MRIKSFVFTALFIIPIFGFSSESLSYEDEAGMAVIGVGSHKCRQYLSSLDSDNRYLYASWAAGYATSFGHIVTKSNDFLMYFNEGRLSSDLNTYCENNEEESIFEAVNYLIKPILVQWIKKDKKKIASAVL
ncbi:hypothetical protein [Neptunomonas japonica]|uniref:Rap1a immunity protein domain-containing protein n=1 Tax=Neptunomonas japonica JAMM 1380 TaxID=1441457 RepID=A0A7R6PBX2_9GAMM|nr:hypothetical protein [Neptunomonas japonica]BBB30859.1 conserved hypothetical protein [Neptunomonas japonica JAMM 1380]